MATIKWRKHILLFNLIKYLPIQLYLRSSKEHTTSCFQNSVPCEQFVTIFKSQTLVFLIGRDFFPISQIVQVPKCI